MSNCTIEPCTERVKARGYCNKHYMRFWRYGDPLYVTPGHEQEDRALGALDPRTGPAASTTRATAE